MKRSTKVIIGVVIGLLVVGGAAAGIIIWRVSEGNKTIAEVTSIDLERTDGETLDLKKVPLDTELVLKVDYRARFKGDGKGTLRLTVTTSEGDRTIDKSYDLKSSGETQTRELKYSMNKGSGQPIEAKAKLTVEQGNKDLKNSKTLAYTAVKGKGAELQLSEAKDAALKKCDEATAAVKELTSLNIDAADLAARLSKALDDLKSATTVAEANAVTQTAQGVIDECGARKTAAANEQARNQDIAAAKQVMYNYANAEKGSAESIDLIDFSMNDQRTQANGTYMGMVTVHTDPDNAGQKDYFYVTAEKQNGQWVVTNFRYEFVK